MKKIYTRDAVALNVLRALNYSTSEVAAMFNVTPYTVRYNTNEKMRNKKRDYQRNYARTRSEVR